MGTDGGRTPERKLPKIAIRITKGHTVEALGQGGQCETTLGLIGSFSRCPVIRELGEGGRNNSGVLDQFFTTGGLLGEPKRVVFIV